MEQVTKDVYGQTTAKLSDVADAVSTLAERTKLAGPVLTDLTTKFANLGEITHTNVNANIKDATAIFAQFGVAAKDQSNSLDILFKASQQAGISFSEFTSSLGTAAPTAKALGLNVGQASALVAQLTPLGLSAGKVMAGLGVEFAKAAKAGEQPTDVISKMIAAIKATKDPAKAATLAINDFGIGSKQAFQLVAAVQGGAFDFGQTLGRITNGKGGINDTVFRTRDLGENLKILEHQFLNTIQPASTLVWQQVNLLVVRLIEGLTALTPYVQQITDILFKGDFTGGPFSEDSKIVDNLFKLREAFQATTKFVIDNKVAFEALAVGIALVVAPIPTLIAAFVVAYNRFEGFRTVVDAVARFMKDRFVPDMLTAFNAIVTFTEAFIGHLQSLWQRFGGDLTAIGRTLFAGLQDEFRVALRVILDLVDFFKNVFTGKWSDAFHNILDIISALGGLAVRNIERMFILAGESAHLLLDAIVQLGPGLLKAFGELTVVAAKGLLSLNLFFLHAGEDLVKGMIQGIGNQAGNLLSTIKDKVVDAPVNLAHRLLGINSPSLVFSSIGASIMEGLAHGIDGNSQAALGALRNVPLGIPGASAASGGTGGSNQLVQLLQAIRANTDPTHPEQQATKQLLVGIKSNTDGRRTVTGAPPTTTVASAVAFQVAR